MRAFGVSCFRRNLTSGLAVAFSAAVAEHLLPAFSFHSYTLSKMFLGPWMSQQPRHRRALLLLSISSWPSSSLDPEFRLESIPPVLAPNP